MKHITNDKGDIAVSRITADVITKGYSVFYPVSSTCPFDLLISKENTFKRVQVKYRTLSKRNTIDVTLRRSIITNNKISHTKNEEVDILAIYCPNTDLCYYINDKEFDKSISLRINSPKNNQEQGVKMAESYTNL